MARSKSPVFQFKKFSVAHDRCGMKIGTDGVLLGAWVNIESTAKILDVGTGSGVIALMLAQRTNGKAHIDAIEIALPDAQQAKENISHSPWPNQVTIHPTSLQEYQTDHRYDLIVSNPPFFHSSFSPKRERISSRHTQSLSFEDILKFSAPLLQPEGRLAVVLPTEEGERFQELARLAGLFPIRKMRLFSKPGKPQERWLLEFSSHPSETIHEQLYIHDVAGDWGEDYRSLTKDFYLHF